MLDRANLHPYQQRTVRFVTENTHCALWLDMGMGKSVSTFTALSDLIERLDVGRVLVVAPLKVARNTWPDEPRKWTHLQDARVCVIRGSPTKRRELIMTAAAADYFVINRELVPWLVRLWREDSDFRAHFKRRWPFDTLVLDESSSFKDRKSQRFRALRSVRSEFSRVIELTGTPAGNGLLGLWSQVFLLDGGERLGKTLTQYRQAYFTQHHNGFSWILNEGAEQKVYDRLDDIVLRLDADDYLDLPEEIRIPVYVELPPKVRTIYRELERDYVSYMASSTVEIPTAAVLKNKLLQCCNGFVYAADNEDARRETVILHDEKIEALRSIVDEHPGRPILVAYTYRPDRDRILAAFPQAVMFDGDDSIVDRWNAGEIEILVAHPASAGHGLNMQDGGNLIVWFGLNWSLELFLQFNARLRRQGQAASTVMLYLILARDTADEDVLARLGDNNTTQRDLLDAMRISAQRRLAA